MSNLCIICSHAVNGVAQIHTDLLKSTLFKEFNDFFPNKFINITNGVTPRRWIHCAFRELSDLLVEYSGNRDWLSELSLLENLPSLIKSKNLTNEFLEKFAVAKLKAKKRLKEWVKENCNINIDESFMFDVQVKRFHEYKRQFMNCLYCIYRYIQIKEMNKEEREKVVKRVTFFGGKAAPGYIIAKHFIQLINLVSFVINNDPETNNYFKLVFLPDYKVSLAQLIIPAADLSQHISTAGTEASGTSNMKFAMTGSLIIGTRDGANIEIAREIGENNIFFFGNDLTGVLKIRKNMKKEKVWEIGDELNKVFKYILEGKFGNPYFIKDYINNIINGGDWYLVSSDFDSYLEAQRAVDEAYLNRTKWYTKTLISISRMGFFSSDRSILDYSDSIWKLKPAIVPKPSLESSKRVISSPCLKLENIKDNFKNSKSHGNMKFRKIRKIKPDETTKNKDNTTSFEDELDTQTEKRSIHN
jgi:starch phosphorylase